MTTPNTDLAEQIAEAIAATDGIIFNDLIRNNHGMAAQYRRQAAAVLPHVEAAVRAGKAEAWDEGWRHAGKVFRAAGTGPRTRNPYREGDAR